jgi:hypothetical protein
LREGARRDLPEAGNSRRGLPGTKQQDRDPDDHSARKQSGDLVADSAPQTDRFTASNLVRIETIPYMGTLPPNRAPANSAAPNLKRI